jgi:hypothetical protein
MYTEITNIDACTVHRTLYKYVAIEIVTRLKDCIYSFYLQDCMAGKHVIVHGGNAWQRCTAKCMAEVHGRAHGRDVW